MIQLNGSSDLNAHTSKKLISLKAQQQKAPRRLQLGADLSKL
ncbi:hypothetical protein S7335_3509 [Synechococcus sp. PCC 7335]|nr:hypothetical protein S7335_3509 [Synechococcus sp. PCC 7335]